MAYDKHTWTCDEPITVERLNHIEDGIANAGGDCDCGYECTETLTTLTEESVTTIAQGNFNMGALSYSQMIDADTITVTFDGTEYECPKIEAFDANLYGGVSLTPSLHPDFSQYPFTILSEASGNSFATETAGTYTVKIEAVEEIVTTTPCFDKARGYSCDEEMVTLTEETATTVVDPEDPEDEAWATLEYSELINQDTITVTFNGTEYECEVAEEDGWYNYGASNADTWDWSEYPFQVSSLQQLGGSINHLVTQNAGTYSIKIEAVEETVTITPCFEAAVKQANEGMGSVTVASRGYRPKTVVLTPTQQSVPANSSAQILFTNNTLALSELATIHSIILPDGIVINSIDFDTSPSTKSIYIRNVTGNDIAVSASNAKITLIDWSEADQVCVMASYDCSSPGPKPK